MLKMQIYRNKKISFNHFDQKLQKPRELHVIFHTQTLPTSENLTVLKNMTLGSMLAPCEVLVMVKYTLGKGPQMTVLPGSYFWQPRKQIQLDNLHDGATTEPTYII